MNSSRVFIVDDDQGFAESLALLLKGRWHAVNHLAHKGKEKRNAA